MIILVCEQYHGTSKRILCKDVGAARAWPFENTDISLDAEWLKDENGTFTLQHDDHDTFYSIQVTK